MNLQQLKYIIAINRFRNFAKAADSCNISQPTLSTMLQKLEDELDVRIFDRSNKQVTDECRKENHYSGPKDANRGREDYRTRC